SPFRVVRVHPIGMVSMPPPVVVPGASKERPKSKAGTIPRTAPRTSPGDIGGRTTTNPAVPPPIQDDANTSTRDYCYATIPRRAKRDARRNRRNAARLRIEPSPARPSACKLRHTTIANPQLSISCANFLPVAVSYAPAFSIEAGQGASALSETYSEPFLQLQKPAPLVSAAWSLVSQEGCFGSGQSAHYQPLPRMARPNSAAIKCAVGESPMSDKEQKALYIVRRLVDSGCRAVFTRGCVRDRILGAQPKDYEVATDPAPP